MKSFYLLLSLSLTLLLGCKTPELPLSDNSSIAIPDTAFEYYLVHFNIDSDKTVNGQIKYKDISQIERLSITPATFPWPTITSLQGIEYFTNLKYLTCKAWAIKRLDVSQNKNLEHLDCSGYPSYEVNVLPAPQISQLILGEGNTKLKYLDCSRNAMHSLDLSKVSSLTELFCQENLLLSLDLRHNPNLKVCWTQYSPQLKTICVASLSQVDSTRSQQGPTNGSRKWSKDPAAVYQVCQ